MSNFEKELICPETGLIFCDPVRIKPTGPVYERIMIQHWIEQGHSTCPYGAPIAPNTKFKVAEDIKNKIKKAIGTERNLSHWQTALYKNYQEAKLFWQRDNNCSDENGFTNSQLEYFQQNAYNAQCQRIALFLLTLSSITAISLILNHYFLWMSLSTLVFNTVISSVSFLSLLSFGIWFSPPQSTFFKGFFPTAQSSAHKNLCEALDHVWNPQTRETFNRYNFNQDPQTILEARKYSLSFAQLVLGCPDLNMFNVSVEKPLPVISVAGKQVTALNPHNAAGPYQYWQFEKSIKQLKAFKATPHELSFPNQIPFLLRPLQGLVMISNQITKACTFSNSAPMQHMPSSSRTGNVMTLKR
jgi:hypothetical protein